MIVRRLAARRLVKRGSTAEQPPPRTATRFLAGITAAGMLAGLAAWFDVWPFGNVDAFIHDVFSSGSTQVPAQVIFPPAPPVHRVVDVYDPPPEGSPYAPAAGAPAGGGGTQSPEPGDGGGGDD